MEFLAPRPTLPVALAFAIGALLLGACNAITGVDELVIESMVPAQGVTIQEIAIYQGIKRSLMGGVSSATGITVPIVAGRAALMRVMVKTDATYDQSDVTAQLFFGQGTAPLQVVGHAVNSAEDVLESSFNFQIPGERLVPGLTYRVALTQSSLHAKGDNTGANYPLAGQETLEVTSDGTQLKVVIVPIQYAADGSNRLPDLSEQQIQGYTDWFYATYPVPKVDVTVRAPWTWNQVISPDGGGWSEVLDALASLRQKDHAGFDVYYFGAFEPSTTFTKFCSSGCVAGLGMVGDPGDDYAHAAVGIGYPGDMAWTTAIHEIGHNHGREHAPCGGAGNVDPKFPYPDGSIGVWGYRMATQTFIDPAEGKDLMGYCDPYWVSDYTYKGLFDRIQLVNQARRVIPATLKNLVWERVRIDARGTLTWLEPLPMRLPPVGRPIPVTTHGSAGTQTAEGHFFPYDHLPGGVLLWPQASAPATGIEVTLEGKRSSLTR